MDIGADQHLEALSDRREGEFSRNLSLWATKVAHYNQVRTTIEECLQRRYSRCNTTAISDGSIIFLRHIKVNAYQYTLVLNIDILDGLLTHVGALYRPLTDLVVYKGPSGHNNAQLTTKPFGESNACHADVNIKIRAKQLV